VRAVSGTVNRMDDADDAATLERREDAATETSSDGETAAESPRTRATVLAGLERYRIGERLAKGGMGEVLLARDEQIGRDVAIKRMRATAPSERSRQRFLREACIQGRLAHPAIVKVHEIGRDSEALPFFVMERLEGTTLAELLQRGLGERPRLLRAFAEVCLAVEFAHFRGIVHRDLKPANIMLGNFGEVFVIDWGVAKVMGEADDEFADVGSSDSGEHVTAVGTAVGTPGYMAPEQVRGVHDIDGRVDVYALGCILFEILAGQPLHPPGRAGLENALRGVDGRPSIRAPGRDIPPELDAVCAAALESDRDRRIATPRELGDRVQRYLDGDRDLALRRDLARERLERATAAFHQTSDRVIAIREAGRALALDPTLTGAAELVTRLMLEPPDTNPPEVEAAIDADSRQTARASARFGMWAYLAFLAFTPLVWWIAPPSGSGFVAAIVIALAINAAVCRMQSRATTPRPLLVATTNGVMVGLVARMFTPFLIAPAIAAVIGMGIVLSNRVSRVVAIGVIVGVMSAGVLVPWLLEVAGVLSTSTTVVAGGLELRAVGIGGAGQSTLIVVALFAVMLIACACTLADAMRTREREAKRHLLLQAWHLRQLVAR